MPIATLSELKECFRPFGVETLYIKFLSPKQDNDKNQIYLGNGLDGVTNLFPATIAVRSPSVSTHKRKSAKGKPKLEAILDFAWITPEGKEFAAPNTRIIDYFQYPEVRLSGFLKGCKSAPDSLRRSRQSIYGRRILVLGTTASGRVLGLVLTEKNDPLVAAFPDLPVLPAAKIFRVLTVPGDVGAFPLDLILADLRKIFGKWHMPVILKPGASAAASFVGAQAAGYTLEALLGVSANASQAPDKYGFEIKSYSGDRISLMTPGADGGYQGTHTFREFMERFGTPGQKHDGSRRFTGLYRCGETNKKNGMTLRLAGYDAAVDRFASDPAEIAVELFLEAKAVVVASWSLEKLANAWNKKHASAIYVPSQREANASGEAGFSRCMFGPTALVGQGTDIWRLLRAIYRGTVFYDPAHTIYANDKPKVRPQWRINSARLKEAMRYLYAAVEEVTP